MGAIRTVLGGFAVVILLIFLVQLVGPFMSASLPNLGTILGHILSSIFTGLENMMRVFQTTQTQ